MKKILILADNTLPEKFIIESFSLGFESNNCRVLKNNVNNLNEEEIKRFSPDMIFGYNYSFLKNLKSTDVIKKLNCKNIILYFDSDPEKNIKLFNEIKKLKAYLFVSHLKFDQKLKKTCFLPLAASPIKYTTDFDGYKQSISFAGNPNIKKRAEILAYLTKIFHSQLKVFCKKTDFEKSVKKIENLNLLDEKEIETYKKSYGGYLTTEKELAKMYNSSKINLNFINKNSSINYRVFEALTSGGFIISEEIENLEKFFTFSRHLETFKNIEDLTDKINFYLKNLNLAQKVAQLGRFRCIEKHNYSARAKCILKTVF